MWFTFGSVDFFKTEEPPIDFEADQPTNLADP
jgi:hypothetical protein